MCGLQHGHDFLGPVERQRGKLVSIEMYGTSLPCRVGENVFDGLDCDKGLVSDKSPGSTQSTFLQVNQHFSPTIFVLSRTFACPKNFTDFMAINAYGHQNRYVLAFTGKFPHKKYPIRIDVGGFNLIESSIPSHFNLPVCLLIQVADRCRTYFRAP